MVTTVLLILALFFGFYMAWNIGANDVANAVGTSVGSGALSLKQAVVIAAIFEFTGAFLLGSNVSETIEAGIVKPVVFSSDMADYIYGMLGALLAAGLWLQIASFFGWPVSTTHSIVGAVVGFGLALGGVEAIFWGQIASIAASWVISPLLGGAIAYTIFTLIRRKVLYRANPVAAAKRLTPFLVFILFAILSFVILVDQLNDLNLSHLQLVCIGLATSATPALIAYILVKRIKEPVFEEVPHAQAGVSLKKVEKHLMRMEAMTVGAVQEKVHSLLGEVSALSEEIEVPHEKREMNYLSVEKIFIYLQIVVACFMAFAHGSNDVANAIGPLSAIVNLLYKKPILNQSVSVWLLLLGGVGIVLGLATWGWRVIETVGKKITELTPSRGFAAGFGAAITVILASKLGLPISTTHVLIGAVLGVGFARGIGAINLNIIRDIVISWVVTIPAGAIISIFCFYLLRAIFA